MESGNKLRIALFLTAVAGLVALKQFTALGDYMTVEHLRAAIEPLGLWGVALFVAAFCAGTVFQVPGILFYTAAFLIFGDLMGGVIAYVGSVLAVAVSFLLARRVGGAAFSQIKNRRIRSVLDKLERRPVLAIGLLRTFLWVSPPLNYALAFSGVPYKKYLLGSTLGLLVPAIVLAGGSCLF